MTRLGVGLATKQRVTMKTSVHVVLNFISSLNWHIQRNFRRNFTLNTTFSMTKEDRNLLLRDISGRLNYGLKVCYVTLTEDMPKVWDLIGLPAPHLADILVEGRYRFAACDIEENIRPYLRPMSSMTEEEKKNYHKQVDIDLDRTAKIIKEKFETDTFNPENQFTVQYCHIDWLNAHHFDYRGLIEKELALEAPEGMYN